MLLGVALGWPAAADQITGKRVALVVGNSLYRYVPRLTNPGNDAKLLAQSLKQAGFQLIGGGAQLDLDKQHFEQAVQDFGRAVDGADVALFYYSGHGLQVGGTNYLVPISANPTREKDLDFQMVSAQVVLDQMKDSGTKLNLVILDACRNNPFSGRGLRAAGGGLAEMHAPEGTLISYATQPGNVASDGDGRDSPFTQALADAMRQPGLDLFGLFNRVGVAVKKATSGQQQPWLALSPVEGDFYFNPPQAGAGKPAAVAPIVATTPTPQPAPAPAPAPERPQQVAAASRPVEIPPEPVVHGFHCPRDGTVSVEAGGRSDWSDAEGRRRTWLGADPDDPHVCLSRIDALRERKLFYFYDLNSAGIRSQENQLADFFNGDTDRAHIVTGSLTHDWRAAGTDVLQVGSQQMTVNVIELQVDFTASARFNHRGTWKLWYDRKSGLLLQGRYDAVVGPRDGEPEDWRVKAIELPQSTRDASAGDSAPVAVATPAPAPSAVTPQQAAPPPVQPVAPLTAAPARPAPQAGGFHCPAKGTASSDGQYLQWLGADRGNPHLCLVQVEGRNESRLFGFYVGAGSSDMRAVDDALSGFFAGSTETATVVLAGQRYTWHRSGTLRPSINGQVVDVTLLTVETQDDGGFGGHAHRGVWTLWYDARDGLMLKGTYVPQVGDRRLERPNWETSLFMAAN
jgi:hypothetical protein